MGTKILQVPCRNTKKLYILMYFQTPNTPPPTPSQISLFLGFFPCSTLTNQIKLREIGIRPNIRTCNRRFEILDFGTLLRIEAFIFVSIVLVKKRIIF